MWYRRHEAQRRYTFFFSSTTLAGAFGGLLASAIGKMDGMRGYAGWRWIFILEGTLTCVVSFFFFFLLPVFPEDAKWLTQEEKDLAIARVKSERVGQTQVLDGIDKKKMLRGIFSPTTLMVSAIFLLNNITVQGKQTSWFNHPLLTKNRSRFLCANYRQNNLIYWI